MKNIFKKYLFNQHVLVNDYEDNNIHWFETVFALAHFFNIHINEQTAELADPDMIKICQNELGVNVPQPFYRGFPQSVLELSTEKLVIDQLIHYVNTYGFGDFSQPGYSLFEEDFKRTAFNEKTPIKEFKIVNEQEATILLKDICDNLLKSTRPLNDVQYAMFLEYTKTYSGYKPKEFASKNTLVKYILDTKDVSYARFMQMSDVIKLVDEINFRQYSNTNIKKLHFCMEDRRFITSVIDKLFELNKCDVEVCFEKKKIWCGLLHHIHYRGKTKEAKDFCYMIRNKENLSAYSRFEEMITKDPGEAAKLLKDAKGITAVLRNLEYILSRCTTLDEVQNVIDIIKESNNAIVLIQLLFKYKNYTNSYNPRTFMFTKYNQMRVHKETESECKSRRTHLNNLTISLLSTKIYEILTTTLKNKLGKVYIDEGMYRYAIPLQNNTSQGGFGVLSTGSRLPIPEGKKVRAFTYWEKVNDIDLSCFGIDAYGNQTEFSWRTMRYKQSKAITYSGDQTSGYHGGSEYFDIDLEAIRKEYPNLKYIIFADNVYSGINFNECICRAGYMMRDVIDSGEVYEPKTVESAYKIDCDSTYAYLFGIDLDTRELVWLNIAREGNTRVAGTTEFDFLLKYFNITECINMQSLFTMMASEIVDTPDAAEMIVTDKEISFKDVEIVHPYDFDKILKYIN